MESYSNPLAIALACFLLTIVSALRFKRSWSVAQCHIVYHSLDVQYMFHNLTNAALESSVRLSEQVIDYWLSFVTMNSKNRLGVDHSQCPASTRWAIFGKLIMMKVATC